MTKIEFEIQIEDGRERRGWRAVGDRHGYFNISENTRINTRTPTVEEARKALVKVNFIFRINMGLKVNLRIVKIETVVTYEVIDENPTGPTVVNIQGANYGAIQM